jgi:hypothetical protein
MMTITLTQLIGEMAWNLCMIAGGLCVAITGPKYLHLIDKGFPEKSRSNPVAAAKQVKILRVCGAVIAFCSLAQIILRLLKVDA